MFLFRSKEENMASDKNIAELQKKIRDIDEKNIKDLLTQNIVKYKDRQNSEMFEQCRRSGFEGLTEDDVIYIQIFIESIVKDRSYDDFFNCHREAARIRDANIKYTKAYNKLNTFLLEKQDATGLLKEMYVAADDVCKVLQDQACQKTVTRDQLDMFTEVAERTHDVLTGYSDKIKLDRYVEILNKISGKEYRENRLVAAGLVLFGAVFIVGAILWAILLPPIFLLGASAYAVLGVAIIVPCIATLTEGNSPVRCDPVGAKCTLFHAKATAVAVESDKNQKLKI